MRQLVQLIRDDAPRADVSFLLNGTEVCAEADGTLLDALRALGRRDVKDGCAPQGQCGCCTVLVDGRPRVSCVTPVSRVAGRVVTTLDGLDADRLDPLVAAFDATAASQCGFCTPGIVVRLAALLGRDGAIVDERNVRTALAAHLCRCTGFQPIVEAALAAAGVTPFPPPRDAVAAAARATLESGTTQRAGVDVVRGNAPFADDTAPHGALVALGVGTGGYEVAGSDRAARVRAGVRQGRNSTVALTFPVAVPDGDFDLTLQTTWVEPGYLEPDASWCAPGGDPASPLGNAGAFGAKVCSTIAADAARMAEERGAAVRAHWTREAVVLRGDKRPPVALGVRRDGTGVLHLARTPGSHDLAGVVTAIGQVAPGVMVEEIDVDGPKVGATHRGAGVAELLAALAVLGARPDGTCTVATPDGALAEVVRRDDAIVVRCDAGAPLCEATTRSFVIGAVHQGFSMVTSEGIAVSADGTPVDLTVRSFGIVPARGMPRVDVALVASSAPAVAVGTAVFAATLAAVWLAEGAGPRWPTRR